ncbi:hypothetical protein ACVBIL_03555 [Shewanella sp. 125m-7]
MKIIDWIAILGALAWSPHLISLIKKLLTKPQVRIIASKRGEIGFSTLGPIFNLRLAFAVKYDDIVISDLKIRLIHESGEERIFEWQGMRQQLSTMTTPDGGIMPNEKEHTVLAIKLNQNAIEERAVQCQETAFLNNKFQYESKTIKRMSYLKEQGSFDYLKYLKSQEMSELFSYIRHSFSWKQGKYEAIIEIESPEKFTLVDNRYCFTLTSIDIEDLEKNKEQIERSFEPLKEDKSNKVVWNWRNPTISKLNK